MQPRHVINVQIRDFWKNESADFNKWLFQEQNLNVLANELGLELIPYKIERKINKGRIDILAIDKSDQAYVLIENQIGKADYLHFAKIIDYIHSIKPKYTIWIVNEWMTFHKNTLDLLIGLTKLFVVKVELLKIGASEVGVKFTPIIVPENWIKKTKTYSIHAESFHIKPKEVNLGKDDMTGLFNEWLDNLFKDETINLNRSFIKRKLLSLWNEHLVENDRDVMSSKSFFGYVNKYCKNNLLFLSAVKKGGVEYYSFSRDSDAQGNFK